MPILDDTWAAVKLDGFGRQVLSAKVNFCDTLNFWTHILMIMILFYSPMGDFYMGLLVWWVSLSKYLCSESE